MASRIVVVRCSICGTYVEGVLNATMRSVWCTKCKAHSLKLLNEEK